MITDKQIKYLRYLIYNYNVKVNVENVMTSKLASQTITKIESAIKTGKVKKRTSRPTNCKVKQVNGVWCLVEHKPDLNDNIYDFNKFAQYCEQENERQHQEFIKKYELELNAN